MRKLILASAAAFAALSPLAALAAGPGWNSQWGPSWGYSMMYPWPMMGWLGGFGLFVALFALVCVALFILWVVMVLDCVKRDFPERSAWLAILLISLFVNMYWLAAILYYVLIRTKNVGRMPPPKA